MRAPKFKTQYIRLLFYLFYMGVKFDLSLIMKANRLIKTHYVLVYCN